MRNPSAISSILLVFLIACSGSSDLLPGQPLATPMPQVGTEIVVTPSQTPFIPTLTITPFTSSTPTQIVPSHTPTPVPILEPISPTVVKICPENPKVPLDKLELGDFYLIVRPYDPQVGAISPQSTGAVVVLLDNPVPQVIPGSNERLNWELIDYKSYDEQFVELVYVEIDGDRRQVWVSSWDGQQEWMVSEYRLPPLPPEEDGHLYYHYRQIDEDWHAAFKSVRGTFTYYPIMLFNQSTGETREIPPFPEETVAENFFWMNESLYMTFSQGSDIDKVMLYNLETDTAVPIFQWLPGNKEAYSLNTFWLYREGKFYIQVIRSYGVDLGIGLDLETVMSNKAYGQVMQAFYLPGPETDFLAGGFYESLNGYFYERYDPEQDITPVFLLRFDDFVMNEYCYNADKFTNSGFWTTSAISPNGRYVAYTHIELSKYDQPDRINRVEILDLMTGEYALLPDANYEVLGWGKK